MAIKDKTASLTSFLIRLEVHQVRELSVGSHITKVSPLIPAFLSFCAVKPRLFRAGIESAGCNATKKNVLFLISE